MIPNYYKILGLASLASKNDIKKAYRNLALQHHPDKNKSANAHETFIAINEAYLILYDNEARKKYDCEYNHFYKQEERQEQPACSDERTVNNHSYQEQTRYKEQETKFEDENLNNWVKNAREQAESFAKMAFNEFSKSLIGVVKETGFQISNIILGILGGLLLIVGLNDTGVFIFTGFENGNPIVIIFAVIGFFIVRFAYQREQKNRVQ